MEKQDVIAIRDGLTGKNPDIRLNIFCDNAIYYRHPEDILHWDDSRGLLIGLRMTADCSYDDKTRYTVLCTSYENIQFITGYHSKQTAKSAVKRLGFTADELKEAEEFFEDIERVSAKGSTYL